MSHQNKRDVEISMAERSYRRGAHQAIAMIKHMTDDRGRKKIDLDQLQELCHEMRYSEADHPLFLDVLEEKYKAWEKSRG